MGKTCEKCASNEKIILGTNICHMKDVLGKNRILTIYIATMGIFRQKSDFSIRAIVLKISISKFGITLKM